MGLSFLAPIFLLGLAAVGIPVLIHLTHRQRRDAVPFPSLMFLRQIPFRTTRRQRIRHWLLFLLRSAAIVLLIGAFARPLLDGAAQPAGRLLQAREVVILLDRSFSMGYGNRWERAGDAARRTLTDLGPEDRASVILFAERTESLARSSAEPAALRAELEDAAVVPEVTRYAPALRLARQILERSDRPLRELVLITDFQRSGWAGEPGVRLPDGTTITPVDLSESSAANLAVTGVSLARSYRGGRELTTVSARLASLGSRDFESVRVSLEVDGEKLEERTVNLNPAGSLVVQFTPFVVPRRAARAAVRAGSDALPGDNVFHFVIRPEDPVQALIVDPAAAGADHSLYLRRALGVGGSPRIQSSVRPVSRLDASDLDGADLVILNDASFPSGALGRRLRAQVEVGRGLLVVLGRRSSPDTWTVEARDFLPAVPGSIVDRSHSAGGRLGFLDRDHSAFEVFRSPRTGDFSVARFFRYRQLAANDSALVLARFDDGNAALVERRQRRGRVVVWASDLSNFWNDLTLQPVFVPFLHQLSRYLAGYVEPEAAFRVGEIIDLSLDPVLGEEVQTEGSELLVENPRGEREVRRTAGDKRFLRMGELGFYQVRSLGGEVDRQFLAAANLDPEESNLDAVDPEELVGAMKAGSGDDVVAAEPLELSPEERERRQGLWWYLLLTMGGILLVETAVSNRAPRATRRH